MDDSWKAKAACRGMNTELWYPKQNGGHPYTLPRQICLGCDVRPDCLAYILTLESREGPRHGMWAATTPEQRLRMARAKARRQWRQNARERASV